MELSLSIQGTASEIRHVLELLEGVDHLTDALNGRGLARFVHHSSPPMIEAIRAIAGCSARDQAVSRAELMAALGVAEESELNGVLGSIGRAWARTVGGDNPFLGTDGPEGGVVYRIDRDLAERLVPLAASWAPHLSRRRRGGGRWAGPAPR